MRILHTNMHRGGWGGQANRILEKSKGLIKMGYEVIIAAPKGATLIERARIFGIDVFDNLTLSKKFNLIYFVKDLINMVLLMKSKRVDVVHTHGSQDSWVASIAARIVDSSIPIVRTRHNIFTVRTHWFNKLLYRILTDYLVAISFAVFDVYKKNGVLGKSIEKVKVIYSAVPVEQVIGDRVTEKEHEFVVVNVGRLAREKAQEFFVKFVSKLKTKLKLKAFILGEGPREHFLRSMSRELKVDDVLVFTGLTDKVKEFLSVADLLVSTSVSEGLGTSIIEALAYGIPVVAFDVGGVGESVLHGKTGYLSHVGEVDSLISFALGLLLNRKLSKKVGINGRKLVCSKFNVDNLVSSTANLYHFIASNNLSRT